MVPKDTVPHYRLMTAVTAAMGAIIAMGVLSACAREEKAPATPAPPPTEKSINPTGGNLFTPPGDGARTADLGTRQPTRQK